MTSVRIYHADRRSAGAQFMPVAEVNTGGLHGDAALDFAYERTQNILGSWSKPEHGDDGQPNDDWSPLVKVLVPLPVIDGVTYGLRSTDVGDVFEIDGIRFLCGRVGFDLLPPKHSFHKKCYNT